MFEPTFGWGGAISLSLMGPSEIFQKKKEKSTKKKLFKFLSFGFKLEKLWFFPFRLFALAEMFEPTFGLGGAIFLSLMSPLEVFKKKREH